MRRARHRSAEGTLVLGCPELSDPSVARALRSTRPDATLCWFWPRRVPESILSLAPAYGVHPSLLPDLRGPDPYYWAVLQNRWETGVTLHRLHPEFDTGPIVTQVQVRLAPGETGGTLARRLDRPSLALLVMAAEALASGVRLPERPQAGPASWAPRPTAADLALSWFEPAESLERKVRAAAPDPGATAVLGETWVRVLDAEVTAEVPQCLRPGEAYVTARGPVVRCGDGGLLLTRGQTVEGTHLSGVDLAALIQ